MALPSSEVTCPVDPMELASDVFQARPEEARVRGWHDWTTSEGLAFTPGWSLPRPLGESSHPTSLSPGH